MPLRIEKRCSKLIPAVKTGIGPILSGGILVIHIDVAIAYIPTYSLISAG